MTDFLNRPIQKEGFYFIDTNDPFDGFRRALAEYGLNPGPIDPSGTLVRFDVEKLGDKCGWYVFFNGSMPSGSFGNWKTGLKQTWCSKTRIEMSDTERDEHLKLVGEMREKRALEQSRVHAEKKELANRIYDTSEPAAPIHPYLIKKKIPALGYIRQGRGNLIVPAQDRYGVIHSLQFIQPDGSKKFLSGGRIEGCSFRIPGGQELYLCEGYATGASIHQATSGTVICAFNAGNLSKVARWVHEEYPEHEIVICADNDRHKAKNTGINAAKEAARAIGGKVKIAFPIFDGDNGTDFNDLAEQKGIEHVLMQIKTTGSTQIKSKLPPQGPESTCFKHNISARPKPIEYIFNYNDQGLLPRGVVGVITATGGTGKSFFLLHMAFAGSGGLSFGPIHAPKPLKTLVIVGEDPQDELVRRAWNICKGTFPQLFHGLSVYGEVGPLMKLESGNPVLADGYYWLDKTINLHQGLEFLILEPKSRFYGLDENNNNHCTQWISVLEYLAKKYNLTILFSHHTGKQESDKMSQNMSRGGSAIVDGCRWQAGLVRMDDKSAKSLGINNPRNYILFGVPKSNYTPDIPSNLIFKRCKTGTLEYVDLRGDYIRDIAAHLFTLLNQDPVEYTKNELIKERAGRKFASEIKEAYPMFKRSIDMEPAIEQLIRTGRIKLGTVQVGKTTKQALKIIKLSEFKPR